MNHPHELAPSNRCLRSQAQQMRLRLAKSRLEQTLTADLGAQEPATLLFIVDRLSHALEDVIKLVEEGCSDGPQAS